MTDIFPGGVPHNGQLQANSTDSLLRVWTSISRQEIQMVDETNPTRWMLRSIRAFQTAGVSAEDPLRIATRSM